MLILPVTVRVPQPSEMPHREDIQELLDKRKAANITQGFVMRRNETHQLAFAFYAEININNNRLWPLFLALCSELPAEACCMYSLHDDEEIKTNYFPKKDILNKLSAFEKELTMDCSLEFGLLYHTKEVLTEIFVTQSKYIRFWGTNKAAFLLHMASFNLKEIPDLAFIDDYPKVVLPLKNFVPSARRPEDVIWSLNRSFRAGDDNY